MANTKIQIKRSTVSTAPTSLDVGELGFSYVSNTLFIGDSTGTGVLQLASVAAGAASNSYADVVGVAANAYARVFANSVGVAANSYADSVGVAANAYARVFANTVGTSANAYADTVGVAANAYASAVGTSANVYADGVGSSSNAYARVFANTVGTSANAYADGVGVAANNYAGVMSNSVNSWATSTFVNVSGDTMTGDLVIQGNLTISGMTTYANTQTLNVGDSIVTLNADLPSDTAPSENAGVEVNRGSASDVAILWNEGIDKWTFTNDGTNYKNIVGNTELESVATSANSYAESVGVAANTYAAAVGVAANTYASSVGVSANAYALSIAANGSAINTGIVGVPYGGTGVTSFTTNGIVYGNNTGDLKVTAAGTEGQVLQAGSTGIPSFGMLDGGSF